MMLYKKYVFIIIFLFISNCSTESLIKKKPNNTINTNYTNKGFTLIYSNDLYQNKLISSKLNERSLVILQNSLKKGTQVKITNLLNNRSVLATVGKKSIYPLFNNSVVSKRIADELALDIDEPYVEIIAISNNSLFVAKKAKMYDEEKVVADKAPIKSISIDDLTVKKKIYKKDTSKRFSYFIKIADFYFQDTALLMSQRIKEETTVKKPKIKKISMEKYRVYLGPFDNINSLQKSYNDIRILNFENIEIIRND